MLPPYRPLPLPYNLFDLAGRQAERLGLKDWDLRTETLINDAQRSTGLGDFGNPYFQVGLEKLLRSLETDANLRFYGRLVMRFMLMNYLSQRLLFVDAQKHRPEAFAPLNRPPIVVTGPHRSGTTFLHRLLALDPANAGSPFWRLYRPFQTADLLDLRRLQTWTELQILKPVFPGLKHKHCIRPFYPEESSWMMGLTFNSMVFWIMTPVTSYLQWLWAQDFHEYYREYGLLLAAQQYTYPAKRLFVKSPDHMPHLDLLLGAVPGARIIQLHRDLTTCVLSLSSLFYSTHIALSEVVQPRLIAKANMAMMAHFIRANRQVRIKPLVNHAVLDIQYEDLVGDPSGTVRRIYEHFGLDFSRDYAAKLSRFLSGQRGGSQRNHHYTAGQFGLAESEIRVFFRDVEMENLARTPTGI